MPNYRADKGYLILADNNEKTNYVSCAETLAKSIKYHHPDAKVAILTNNECDESVFDFVIDFPYPTTGEQWKLSNDWQAFYATPFHETIKLEADMLCSGPIDHWWTFFRNFPLWVSTGCRNLHNQRSQQRYYRKVFDENHLPDTYNALMYWRASREAQEFFSIVQTLFDPDTFESAMTQLKFGKYEKPNTDLIYALALMILGYENFTTPDLGPSIVHMKQAIIGSQVEQWYKDFVWEITNGTLKVNALEQQGLVHYYHKELAVDFGKHYV